MADSGKGAVETVAVELPSEIFDRPVNIPLIHQVVVAQRAAARQGTHSTKTRGEVRGGGRKPYKQKGTGRARQGSTRAPQFTGGGVVHGPQPRSYDQRTPKKMKAAALRGVLSDRARDGRIHVVESLVEGTAPSTKGALAALLSLTDRRSFLVVLERSDTLTWLSLRNAPEAHLVAVDQVNTYDVISTDDVVFTKAAYDAFVTGTAASSERPASIVEPAGADAVTEPVVEPVVEAAKPAKKAAEPEAEVEAAHDEDAAEVVTGEYANSAEPPADGSAPEGYPVKGNTDSMKFHEPDGRWFDATVAEVWFRTAADAEAAGFVKAGSKKEEDS